MIVHVTVLSPTFAVISDVPTALAVNFPFSTEITLGFELVHVTSFASVVFCGLYMMLSVSVAPSFISLITLSNAIELSGIAFTVSSPSAV